MASHDPASGELVWEGTSASNGQVTEAIVAARRALGDWERRPLGVREELLKTFARIVGENRDRLAEAICRETGKPMWEALEEARAMVGKVTMSIDAQKRRRVERFTEGMHSTSEWHTWYRPVGVVAVMGPFNLPAHLPNGHIVPALLAGNTVVFKPSERTPLVGQLTAELWELAGLPPGVFNMIQGGRSTGALLCAHEGIDAVLFTGSYAGGRAIAKSVADHPERLLVLEMGGNNPLVAWDVKAVEAAAYGAALSAFITAGQRCSCARRLIVSDDAAGNEIIERVAAFARRMRVGPYTNRPEPFMGPVITAAAADSVLAAQNRLIDAGARSVLNVERIDTRGMLRPGVVDVTAVADRPDEEVFGPLLQVIQVEDFPAALREANRTAYGLAAGIMTDRRDLHEVFKATVRAGVVNWNNPLTGARSFLPFGGVGRSGNHRASSYFAADYCSDPVASTESEVVALPEKLENGIDE